MLLHVLYEEYKAAKNISRQNSENAVDVTYLEQFIVMSAILAAILNDDPRSQSLKCIIMLFNTVFGRSIRNKTITRLIFLTIIVF